MAGSFSLSLCLFVSICLSVSLCVSLSLCLCVSLSQCLSVSVSLRLSVSLSVLTVRGGFWGRGWREGLTPWRSTYFSYEVGRGGGRWGVKVGRWKGWKVERWRGELKYYRHTYIHTDRPSDEAGCRGAFTH